jgi:hypothetical protein
MYYNLSQFDQIVALSRERRQALLEEAQRYRLLNSFAPSRARPWPRLRRSAGDLLIQAGLWLKTEPAHSLDRTPAL